MRRFFFAAAVAFAAVWSAERVEAQTPRRVENLTDLHRATFRLRAVDASGRGRVGTGSLNALDGGRYLGSANWRVAAFASRSFSGTDAPFPFRRESNGLAATIVRPTAPSCRFKPTR